MTDLAIRERLGIQYGRDDVDYHTWYNDWMQQLAQQMTRDEIERKLGIVSAGLTQAAKHHHAAVAATASMGGQSMRRAHARNVVAAASEHRSALRGALEIHYLFPEHALGSRDTTQGAER